MGEKAEEELDSEAQKLLKIFYETDDPQQITAAINKILALMEPTLRRLASSKMGTVSSLGFEMEDLYQEARLALYRALRNSQSDEPITSLFAYAGAIVHNLFLMSLRKKRARPEECGDDLESAIEPKYTIEAYLAQEATREDCDAGWNFLSQCRINARRVVVLNKTQAEIFAWVWKPDPCPALAEMLEINEEEARELWKRLPVNDKEIAADVLKTSVEAVQKLRSETKSRMRAVVLGETKKKPKR